MRRALLACAETSRRGTPAPRLPALGPGNPGAMIELSSDAPAEKEGRALQRGAAGTRPSGPAGDGRGETEPERDDRNLSELSGELRVVVTGVQVLFALLLVVPFDVGFDHAKAFERTAYFVT